MSYKKIVFALIVSFILLTGCNKPSVSEQDLAVVTQKLSILISSGVPILQSFNLLSKETSNAKLKKVLLEIENELSSGSKLSVALKRHDDVFPESFIVIVYAGEETGNLENALNSLARYYSLPNPC